MKKDYCLFEDGLHLLEEGKSFLANNFLKCLNRDFLRNAYTPSTGILLEYSGVLTVLKTFIIGRTCKSYIRIA